MDSLLIRPRNRREDEVGISSYYRIFLFGCAKTLISYFYISFFNLRTTITTYLRPGECQDPPVVLNVRLPFPSYYVSDGGLLHFRILRLLSFLLVFFLAKAYRTISVWTGFNLQPPTPDCPWPFYFLGSKLTLSPS